MAVSFLREHLSLCSAFAAPGALSPSTGASFSPTRVISWRSKIPTTKRGANDRGRCVGKVGFSCFHWFLPLPSHTAWGPRLPCSSPAPRGWSACNRPPARFCACEGPPASPPQSVHWLRDPDGDEAHSRWGKATIHQKSEKSQEQSRDKCFSLIQDNGFNRWKSKIAEG